MGSEPPTWTALQCLYRGGHDIMADVVRYYLDLLATKAGKGQGLVQDQATFSGMVR